MATCVRFQSQVSSILEATVRSAAAEICKLLEEKCAFLHLEVSRKQSENELLRRNLQKMENKHAQLQQDFEKYLERGIALENSCASVTANKFPDLHDNGAAAFTIKEESPEELWIRDPSQTSGSVQFSSSSSCEGFEKNCHLEQNELNSQKTMDFARAYNPPHQNLSQNRNLSQNFTVKTEKDENRSGFEQDSCQHRNLGKPPPHHHHHQTNDNHDFCLDERDNQLWSSIMDGNEIEAAFPDFSSVVEEYSNAFPEQSKPVVKPGNVQSLYSEDFPKDAQQPGSFQATFSNLQEREDANGGMADQEGGGVFDYGSPSKVTGRGYVCVQCGKTFGRLHQFKLHQQSHRRKRAFWCAVCGKSFQCSSHLRIHHRTHTGEKPYGCSACGKRFTQQSSLRVHQRTHSGERPYGCSLCGKTFILMHHLKRHKVIHTYSG